MSKYEPLKRHLLQLRQSEVPMTFTEVEGILGFKLPPSARKHPPWWSNNVGTHVNAAAWREAGWKTIRVDVPGERVTFVREERTVIADGVAEGSASWPARHDAIAVPLAALSKSALRMIDDTAEELGGDRGQAIAAILDGCALQRRRQLLDSFSGGAPSGFDSVAAIREDRDGR